MDKQSLQKQITDLPMTPGVYIFRDENGKTLYIGKSVRLRDRVRSYFHISADLGERTSKMVSQIDEIDHIQTQTEFEALLLEADLIKRLKPEYNVQWRDDKRYKYIRIFNFKLSNHNKSRGQVWPHVTTSRKQNDPNSLYFGPFPEGRTVNRVLKTLRKIFPWCGYKDEAALRRAGRPCLYYHINQCPGICAGRLSLEEYWEIIDDLVEFLSGSKQELIEKYRQAMQTAAAEKSFEHAARFRDKIKQLEYVTQQFRDSSEYIQNPNLVQDIREQETQNLIRELNRASQQQNQEQFLVVERHKALSKFRIEAYDISNLGEDYTTASRVVFVGGEPNKSEYRRYKIKLENTPNDVAAMKEVLSRRFKHSNTDPLPDLILIDGGKGQVSAALEVLANKNLANRAPVIGIAKKEETLIVPRINAIQPPRLDRVDLPPDSPALKLLQRVRDEAHRFAHSYHRYLRRRKLSTH